MTVTDEHTHDHVPDHVLEQQAAEHAGHAPTTHRSGAPPHDADAEEALLGACLTAVRCVEAALDTGLDGHHFYNQTNATIYDAICTVVASGARPDIVTVAAHLGHDHHRQLHLFLL